MIEVELSWSLFDCLHELLMPSDGDHTCVPLDLQGPKCDNLMLHTGPTKLQCEHLALHANAYVVITKPRYASPCLASINLH